MSISTIYNMHSFSLVTSGGYTANNIPNAATTTAVKGFLTRKRKLVIQKNGEQVLSEANIQIDYNSTVTTEDTVVFDGRTWQIVAIEHEEDFSDKITRLYLL